MFQAFALLLVLLPLVATAGSVATSRSEPVAKQLVQLLQQQKLESIACREADDSDRFVAVLYLPGQLLLVSARYTASAYLREYLIKGDYKSAYVALSTSGEPENKYFVQDLGADGLHPTRLSNAPFDTIYESVTNRTAFDGDWRRQKLSETGYQKLFQSADQRYATLLSKLVEEAKRRQAG